MIHLRLPVAIIAIIAACLIALGITAVRVTSDLTRDTVHRAALDLVTLRAKEIESFFAERGRVVTTVLADPTVLEFFAGYDSYRRPLDGDPDWHRVQRLFQAVVAADPTIISVFLATDSTSEYFRNEGRVEREGYDPKQRWWWSEALDRDTLYVSPPGVDAGTGDVSVTVQTTVYLDDGRFIGVAGIDVLLGTLGALVEGITYQGVGSAFLVDGAGNIIYFPEMDLSSLDPGARLSTELGAADRVFPATSGFSELAASLDGRASGLSAVRWRGEPLIVVHVPVHAESPRLSWNLGLMVPERLITSTIIRVRVFTALSILIAVTSIAGLTLLVTTRVNTQLRVADRRRARALTEANLRLLEADQMKTQFLTNMSHELRTPLNSIIGFSEILRTRLAGQLEPRLLHFLDNIHSSGQHLLTMISDILDLSKVEAGRLELRAERLVVAEVIDGVCAIVQGMAKDKSVRICADAPGDLPEIEVDPVRFRQILFNLLSNAVKFSDEGGRVTVEARFVGGSSSPINLPSLAVAVRDDGIGMSESDQEVIFDQFRQVDGTGGREYPGTGLGLALVRRLVELHGGRITVSSEVGRGSTFTVILPLRFTGSIGALP